MCGLSNIYNVNNSRYSISVFAEQSMWTSEGKCNIVESVNLKRGFIICVI